MTRTIAVDFDGVIHAYSEGWKDGTIYDVPMPGAFEGLRKLMEYHAVVIFTTRNSTQVAIWLMEQAPDLDVRVDDPKAPPEFWDAQDAILVTNRKLPAVYYIDDRAIRFLSWDQALADVFGLPL